jgi:hypothetical protein
MTSATAGAIYYRDYPQPQVTDGSSIVLRFSGAEFGLSNGYFVPTLYPAASSNMVEWWSSSISLALMEVIGTNASFLTGNNRSRTQNFTVGTGGQNYSLTGVTGGIEIIARPSYP